jgi:hypothetical protein
MNIHRVLSTEDLIAEAEVNCTPKGTAVVNASASDSKSLHTSM